jgi:hypothetical protein
VLYRQANAEHALPGDPFHPWQVAKLGYRFGDQAVASASTDDERSAMDAIVTVKVHRRARWTRGERAD